MTTQTLASVSCPGCSQTYRIPTTTRKAAAPCKKCGATIDLTALAGAEATSSAPARRAAAPAPAPSNPAAEAVRNRSTRAQRALGVRTRQPVSPVHIATGVLVLAAVVVAAVVGLS